VNGRPRLLALDDDQLLGDVVLLVGREVGFDVTSTSQPEELEELLPQVQPDVIMVDLQMPRVDGVKVLRHLADRSVGAAILLVSGMDLRTIAGAEQYGKSRGLRMLGALQKPFSPEELMAKLASVKSAIAPLTAADLVKGMERNELQVYYQPTIQRFADGTWDVAAMEALVRWHHPEKGVLAPDSFIAMSEEEGLGRAITDYVIQCGVEQLKVWQATRLNIGLRVNLPAILIADVEFPDRLEALLVEQEVDPAALTVEITETAMLDKNPDTIDILTRMRVKNINLAIDDFGIGYSSLTQLFEMPFNEMKIDKSLVSRAPHSKEARIMIEALVDLAHKLNLTVCAEGVESKATLDFLSEVGCDSAQGYFISRPVTAKEIPRIISGWSLQHLVASA
jgi:EAL domain-containing protein (putative c-di-GMP-specific phosphodiesterase class I)/CheY-like chemotaxis protein